LDKVLAGLNPAEVSEMLEIIEKIRVSGVTILMIEHLMHAIMNVSDRVIVLDYGVKIAEGKPCEAVTIFVDKCRQFMSEMYLKHQIFY